MSITLNKLARKFTLILKKRADEFDPLLKHPGTKEQYIDPEMTEELDEVVKDSLHLVILLQRSMSEFAANAYAASGETKELGSKFADKVLSELQEIETNLQNPALLEFELNTEKGLLDTVAKNVEMIQAVFNLVKPHPREKMPESFKALDQRIFKWLDELSENVVTLADRAMAQSPFMDRHFSEHPMQMREQVDMDVDQINREDINSDHPDFDPGMDVIQREEDAVQKALDEEGETPHPMDLKNWGEEFSSGVKNFSDRWEQEGDHWVEKKN